MNQELNRATRNRDAERRTTELRRAAVFAWYGQACACCTATSDLCIDHVDGDGPAQRATALGRPGRRGYNPATLYRWIIEHGFPGGFQTMCKPCNSSKQDGDRCRLYHGELGEYEKWCTGCLRIRGRRTDFNSSAGADDGLSPVCRECAHAASARWRERSGKARSVTTRPGTAGGRILAYLGEYGPSRHAEIVAGTGLSFSSVSVNMTGLVQDGHVVRPARGLYCLPAAQEVALQVARVYTPPPGGWTTGGKDWAAGTTWTTKVTDVTDVP